MIGAQILAALTAANYFLYGWEDFLLFARGNTIILTGLLLNLFFLSLRISRSKKSEVRTKAKEELFNLTKVEPPVVEEDNNRWDRVQLLLPVLLFEIGYTVYLALASDEAFSYVVLANFMVAFYATMFIHQFFREQYLATISGIVLSASICVIRPHYWRESLFCCIAYLVSWSVAWLQRREFVGLKYQQFRNFLGLFPAKISMYLATNPEGKSAVEAFPAKKRYAICLSADWRGYQALSEKIDAATMVKLFETYYGIIFTEMEKILPNGNYFPNWIADELFVIFYLDEEEGDTERDVTVLAAAFAVQLATSLYDRLEKELFVHIDYDIGIAAGYGILGVQGPPQALKTTLTANSAGIAKRLQTEAKNQRQELKNRGKRPILMMDETIRDAAVHVGLFDNSDLVVVENPKTKDLGKGPYFAYRKPTLALVKPQGLNAKTIPAASTDKPKKAA